MAAPKRTHEQVLTDRETVWQLKLGGLNNSQIARKMSMTRQMVVYDIRAIVKQKENHINEAVSVLRSLELDRLNRTIREAHRGWQRSVTERRRSRTRTGSEGRPGRRAARAAVPGQQDQSPAVIDQERHESNDAVVEVEERAGDARFLAVMLRAVEQRIDLLGLVNRERGPDIPNEPVRLIVIRRDVAREPSNSDVGDDDGLERQAIKGEYVDRTDRASTDVDDEDFDDPSWDRVITRRLHAGEERE